MASVIRRLPQALANQIAAGEVVQRPASVLKELVENALDAGADRICVFIENAGKSLIQVTDNGIGMSEEDAQLCFERHATSKIYSAEELFAIRSMGFRGEALAAIAAVSQIELITRREEDELATQLNLEAGDILKKESAAASKGTSIAVRNVFFNVPARRNFLRSNPVETRHLISEFQRIALAYPQINFELQIDSTQIFHLKSSSQRKRIVALLGKSVDERLVPVEEETDLLRIHGFVGKPSKAKKTRGEQFFFVNGRFFRSSYLNHAIQGVYEGLIPEKHHPLYVLFIELDPGRVDVNVHPQKQEVKFEEEKIVYAYMQAAVRHALSKYSATPSLDFDTDAEFGHLDAFKRPVDRSQISISNPNRQDRMRQEGKSAQLPGSPGLLAEEAPWEALFKQAGNEVKEVPDSENLRLDDD
jgi:DNA mismatch repair protein MutL